MTDNNYNLNTDFFQELGIEAYKIECSITIDVTPLIKLKKI